MAGGQAGGDSQPAPDDVDIGDNSIVHLEAVGAHVLHPALAATAAGRSIGGDGRQGGDLRPLNEGSGSCGGHGDGADPQQDSKTLGKTVEGLVVHVQIAAADLKLEAPVGGRVKTP